MSISNLPAFTWDFTQQAAGVSGDPQHPWDGGMAHQSATCCSQVPHRICQGICQESQPQVPFCHLDIQITPGTGSAGSKALLEMPVKASNIFTSCLPSTNTDSSAWLTSRRWELQRDGFASWRDSANLQTYWEKQEYRTILS